MAHTQGVFPSVQDRESVRTCFHLQEQREGRFARHTLKKKGRMEQVGGKETFPAAPFSSTVLLLYHVDLFILISFERRQHCRKD